MERKARFVSCSLIALSVLCSNLSAVDDQSPAGFDCCAGLSAAVAILDEDVYAHLGDRIKSDVGTAAEKRIFEKSADYRESKQQLLKCEFKFTIGMDSIFGQGDSNAEPHPKLRAFLLFAGIINEADIIKFGRQNSRGVVALDGDAAVTLRRAETLADSRDFVLRLSGFKTAAIGDMAQFPVGMYNTGKHFILLGGLTDEQTVNMQKSIAGGGPYSLVLNFSLAGKTEFWKNSMNPMEGVTGRKIPVTKKTSILLLDSDGNTVKSYK